MEGCQEAGVADEQALEIMKRWLLHQKESEVGKGKGQKHLMSDRLI